MLSGTEVAPFLLHADSDVRDHAVRYFAEAHDPAPVTAEDFWAIIDRYGAGAAEAAVSQLSRVPQTAASLRRALAAVADPDVPEDANYHYQRAIEAVDFDVLCACRDEVLNCDAVVAHVREHLAERLRLADVGADEAWRALEEHAADVDDAYVGDFDRRISERLIERLGRADAAEAAAARALERIRGWPEPDGESDGGGWMEIFCVDVIGAARYAPAVATLVEGFLVDADLLRDRLMDALVRIGNVEVVRAIEALVPGKRWDVRLYADGPLGRIKRPESEAALLNLMKVETDPGLLTGLADGLGDLCSAAALPLIRDLIVSKRDDPQTQDLRKVVLTVGAMVGDEPPEAAAWRAAIAREQAARERRLRRFEKSADPWNPKAMRERWRAGLSMYPPAEAERPASEAIADARYDVGEVVLPIKNEAPKVGRNDPCPCGSGKKYKKCCLSA